MLTAQDWVTIIVGIIVVVAGGYLTHVFSSARQRVEEKFLKIDEKLKYIEEVAEKCREKIAVNDALDNERKENHLKIENKLERIEEKINNLKHG